MRLAAAAFAAVLLAAPASWAIGPTSTDPADLPAGTWVLDRPHSSVIARVRHMGYSRYTVRFDRFDAVFTYDPKTPSAARVTASVEPGSLDTGTEKYDEGFVTRFLGAEKITFVSTAVTPGAAGRGTMTGDLTFHGVTRPVTFEMVFYGVGPDLNPLRKRAGFSAVTTIKRSSFGSTSLLDPPIVGDDVEIVVEAEFLRQ